MSRTDCLFCKIADGIIPATIVFENEEFVVFRDINPAAPSHLLLIPRAHYANAAEMASAVPELAGRMLAQAGKLAVAENIADQGYRLVFNTGEQAGQTVFHVHLHLLGGRSLSWPPG